MTDLMIEVGADDKGPQDDWLKINQGDRDVWYRPLAKEDEVLPNRVILYRAKKWFIPVDLGTEVKAGQLLAVIDPITAVDDLDIKVRKLNSADAERKAEIMQRDEYRARWKRAEDLFAKGAIALEDRDAAKLAYDYHVFETVRKEEDVKVARSEVRQAKTLLDLYQIRSKIDGTVKSINKHKGESVRSLETVLEMENHKTMRIYGRVDFQDIESLPTGGDPNDKRIVEVEATRIPPLQSVLSGHLDAVTSVAISKDNQVISVSDDRTVRVWKNAKMRTEREVYKLKVAVCAVACTPMTAAKNLCLTGGADGNARLYDLKTPNEEVAFVRQFANGHKEAINCVAFSPDGRWAVTGGDDRAICLWDVDSGDLKQRFPKDEGHKGGVTSVAFRTVGPDKKLSVVSAGRDNALIVWPLSDEGTPEKPTRLDGRVGEVQTLGVNPTGDQVLFDQGKDLRLLSPENGALLGTLSASGGTNFGKVALFSPDGKLVLTTTSPGRVQLWRTPTAETRGHELQHLIFGFDGNERAITTSAAFAPDGSFLVTGTKGGNVIVWPMPSKEEIERRLYAHIIHLDPEVNSGTVRVTAELEDAPSYLLPGTNVTLVVYPEK